MNEHIKKKRTKMIRKRELKLLRQFVRQIKQLAYGVCLDTLPEHDVDTEYLSKFTKELCAKTVPNGFVCSDVIMNQSDGVISETIYIAPIGVPIELTILKNRKEDTFIE